jgi:hypothetical protein
MSERTTTQYPATDPMVITAPLNVPVSVDTLLGNSVSIAGLQAQITANAASITALAARVTALENAASGSSGTTA